MQHSRYELLQRETLYSKENMKKFSLFNLALINAFTITQSLACSPLPNGIEIQHGKRYANFNNSHVLSCVDNLGLSMCISHCIRTMGCSYVHYDELNLYCDLIQDLAVVDESRSIGSENMTFVDIPYKLTVSLPFADK